MTMKYVLAVTHVPEKPAAYGRSEITAPSESIMYAALKAVAFLLDAPYHPTAEEAQAFATELMRVPPGTPMVQMQTGMTFQVHYADNAPHPCPCGIDEGENTCGRLVLPTDHPYAFAEDAYCPGCFTWNRGDVQCLPANTGHTEEP